ncbi:MAG: hypothetical protein KC736_03800 [Candidatus Moranbacteria bacterium]|nr:hypothetical protein [Candidatus Moranbacteria bacterium]
MEREYKSNIEILYVFGNEHDGTGGVRIEVKEVVVFMSAQKLAEIIFSDTEYKRRARMCHPENIRENPLIPRKMEQGCYCFGRQKGSQGNGSKEYFFEKCC